MKLADHFQDLDHQAHAARLGMWLFLGSEVLLFAGLFALYAAYRVRFGDDFLTAAGHNNRFLGTLNTLVLITSSYTVAAATHATRAGQPRRTLKLLATTVLLGIVFLGVKAIEYRAHFREGIFPGAYYQNPPSQGARMFFTLYYLLTGLHGLHVIGGLTALTFITVGVARDRYTPERHLPLELGGLYWHLVDVIWIFLWPLLYLAR